MLQKIANVIKGIQVGMYVIQQFIKFTRPDGSLSVKDILDIGVQAAIKAGYPPEEVEWTILADSDIDWLESLEEEFMELTGGSQHDRPDDSQDNSQDDQ